MQFNLVPDPLLRHRLHLAENVFEQFSLERSIEIILSRNNVALLGIPGCRTILVKGCKFSCCVFNICHLCDLLSTIC